jgi:uncharacterized delta-60 repeat protein
MFMNNKNIFIKSLRVISVILVLASGFITVVASGGGGGNGDQGSAPVISNFTYSPSFTLVGSGGGKALVTADINFADDNGNISSMTLNVFDSNNNLIGSTTGPIEAISGKKSGVIEVEAYADTTLAGEYTFQIYLVDDTNLKSNVLRGKFVIFNANPPTIINLIYSTTSSNNSSGGETSNIQASVNASDTDGNISTITITAFDQSHNQIKSSTSPASITSGMISGTTQVQMDFDHTKGSIYTFEVYITDSTNLSSNILIGTSDGNIDSSFADAGVASYNSSQGLNDGGSAVVVQADGKIVVAGHTSNGMDNDVLLLRYNSDGTLDSTFGTNGVVIYNNGGIHSAEEAYALSLQPDGKIIIAGYTYNFSGIDWENILLIRYNSNGTLDNTFGNNGVVSTNVDGEDYGYALALQSDGKIVIAGKTNNFTDTYGCMLRYNSDGTLDTTFGTNGVAKHDGIFQGVAIQSDGKIVAAGGSINLTNKGDMMIVRYDSNGTLDNTFGTDGKTQFYVGESSSAQEIAASVVIQPDGKIVTVGFEEGVNNSTLILRYNSNGTLDNTFGTNGVVMYDPTDYPDTLGKALALQSDGKIIITGTSNSLAGMIVLRYNNNGTLDTSFSEDGVGIYYGGLHTFCYGDGVALQSDGKIVVTGSSSFMDNGDNAAMTIRLLGQ